MEFDNIKTSVALIYDEFIQNAGGSLIIMACFCIKKKRRENYCKPVLILSAADSRTENWLLMSSPLPQTIIIVAYIYFVTSLGPRLMENRKAFDLKGVLIVYNFSVVALSLYMCYEVSCLCFVLLESSYSVHCREKSISF